SLGFPLDEVGFCAPQTPFGEPNKYTCQPTFWSPSSTLAPGTYYWWLSYMATDPGSLFPTTHVSGPFQFTVTPPTPPGGVSLLAPDDRATVSAPIGFQVAAPAGVTVRIYAGLSPSRRDDGSPLGLTVYSCGGQIAAAGPYSCTDTDTSLLIPGESYYWWAVVTTADAAWVYGPRTFTLGTPSVAPPTPAPSVRGGSPGGLGSSSSKTWQSAATLPASDSFDGSRSVKQTTIGSMIYATMKLLRLPKRLAVACWTAADFEAVEGSAEIVADPFAEIEGFWLRFQPRWLHLAPRICRDLQSLIDTRRVNGQRAGAVAVALHEAFHAHGVRNEAETNCYAVQLAPIAGRQLDLSAAASRYLGQLAVRYTRARAPDRYWDPYRCRDGGRWDLLPGTTNLA